MRFSLQIVLEKQAGERLRVRTKIIQDNISLLPSGSESRDPSEFFKSYRETAAGNGDSENDEPFTDNEDDGEEPERGGVYIPLD